MKFDDLKNNVKAQFLVLATLTILILAVLFIGLYMKKPQKTQEVSTETTSKDSSIIVTQIVEKEVEKFVEIEKEITTEIIKDGLNDMGFLITQEYFFTQVENYTSTKKLFTIIPLESSFVYSYDGVVAAGLDCGKIQVKKDDDSKVVRIYLPKAEIKYTTIDNESFQVYSEKEGFGNKLTLNDYNASLDEFKKMAEERAIDKGILEKADQVAELMIKNFINSLLKSSDYTVVFEYI